MITRRIALFDRFILKPLSFLFLVLAVVYFFQRAWIVGAFSLVAWFIVGVIGQSLHKDKTLAQLTRGDLTSEEKIAPGSEISHDEARTLARPMLFASWLCGITAAVLLFHHDYRWFIAFPVGLAVAILSPILCIIALRPRA